MAGRVLTPKRRFAAWAVLVALPLLAGCLFLPGLPALDLAAAVVIAACIAGMWWLLETTPPDAIRLGLGTSRAILALGALWLLFASHGLTPFWFVLAGMTLLGLVLGPAIERRGAAWAERRFGRASRPTARPSPWVGVWFWSPAVLSLAGPFRQVMLRVDLAAPYSVVQMLVCLPLALVAVLSGMAAFLPGLTRRPRGRAWALVLFTLASVGPHAVLASAVLPDAPAGPPAPPP